jgi:predicted transcriptional regulator
MAKNGKSKSVQQFVREQLEEARERFQSFEHEAEDLLRGLIVRGKAQRRELESLMDKLNAGDLLSSPAVKQLGKRANQASNQVKRRLDQLQRRVVEATGVASQSQVKEINRELNRLSKKIDTLLKKPPRPDARA